MLADRLLNSSTGFLKKKKKAKTAPTPAADSSKSGIVESVSAVAATAASVASAASEIVLSAPETAPVALAVSAAAGLASA